MLVLFPVMPDFSATVAKKTNAQKDINAREEIPFHYHVNQEHTKILKDRLLVNYVLMENKEDLKENQIVPSHVKLDTIVKTVQKTHVKPVNIQQQDHLFVPIAKKENIQVLLQLLVPNVLMDNGQVQSQLLVRIVL